MSNTQEAIAYIERLANLYKPLLDVRDLLAQFTSLEASVNEMTAKRDHLLDELRQLEADLEVKTANHGLMLSNFEAEMVSLNEQAARVELQANEKIQAMFIKAEADAKALGDQAFADKLTEVNGLDAQVIAARQNLLNIQADTETAIAQRDQVLEEKAHAEAGLAEVVKTIEQLSKFGSVPGGA